LSKTKTLLLAVICDLIGFHGFKVLADWLLSSYYGLITCLCLHVWVQKGSTWNNHAHLWRMLCYQWKIKFEII